MKSAVQFLEPFVKEEAARASSSAFHRFWNEKVEEIKRDSVKRTRSKDIVVEKLFSGKTSSCLLRRLQPALTHSRSCVEWYNVKTSTV